MNDRLCGLIRYALVGGFILSIFAAGCHGQVPPPTSHVVNITITPPANCTGCSFAIYRCSASATACGDTTNIAWSEITASATRPTGTSYVDDKASGMTAYYVAETYDSKGAHSGPSNTVGPLVVPASPLAPGLNGTAAEMVKPALKAIDPGTPQVARLELKAVVR